MREDISLENNPLVIVDVGASGGVDSRWENTTPFFTGILFEPDPREYDALKRVSGSGLVVLNAALLDSEDDVDFHLCKKQQVSSVYLPNFNVLNRFYDSKRFEVIKTIRLKTDTLDNQMRKNGTLDIDFIKIDTQGSELSILKGGVDSLKNLTGLEIEVEFVDLYEGQPLFDDVDSFVRKYGFELFDIKRYFWKRDNSRGFGSKKGQLVCGDALYFRSPEAVIMMGDISQEKIMRSMYVYLAYGYADLAQALIDGARNMGILSPDTYNAAELIVGKFAESNLIPNFKGKGRIQRVIQGIANMFSVKGPYTGTDQSLGNP